MKVFIFLLFCLLSPLRIHGADARKISDLFQTGYQNPFQYDMNIQVIPGKNVDAEVTLFLHGYGGDYSIAGILNSYGDISEHLVAFNFPDYRILERGYDISLSSYGTINELLPVIYMLKKLVIDGGLEKINMYGFSAGGAAVINTLAILNTNRFVQEIKSLGVGSIEKKKILDALQKGWLLLDAPLKSLDEIYTHKNRKIRKLLAEDNYIKNRFNPIDNLKDLKDLQLNIIVYFEVPDASIGNRLDAQYSKMLKAVNPNGKTIIIFGTTPGGHIDYHGKLWKEFNQIKGKN